MIPYIYQELGYVDKEILIMLLYLCDWKAVLKYGKPMTTTKWIRSIYGTPMTKDRKIDENCLNNDIYIETHLEIVNFVIETYKKFELREFFRLVQSTYPMFFFEPHGEVDFEVADKNYSVWRNKVGKQK